MVDLDAVIRRARSATVRRDAAEAYVRDFERSTSDHETQRATSHSPESLKSLGSPSASHSPGSLDSADLPGSSELPGSLDSLGSRWLPWSRGRRGSHRPDESIRQRWLIPLIAAAAAGVIAVAVGLAVIAHDDAPPPIAAVRVGERVAIVVEPGTVYRIIRAGGDETAIEVERGEVTARLWPGTRAHRLTLQGGGVVALAQGTVYSLAVERGTGAVQVDEGTVEVHVGAEVHRVPAGTSWPPDRPRPRGRDRAPVLTALAAPHRTSPAASSTSPRSPSPSPSPSSSSPPSTDIATAALPSTADDNAPATSDPIASAPSSSVPSASASSTSPPSTSASSMSAASPSAPSASTHSGSSDHASAPKPSPSKSSSPSALPDRAPLRTIAPADAPRASLDRVTLDAAPPRRASSDVKGTPSSVIKSRWQLARRLRAEGKMRLAIAECIAIADLHDPTWAPIALVEAIRLYAGPLADPAHAIAIADRLIAEWPADVLVPEARQLRCRALGRLGRGQECELPPTP